MNVEGYLPEQLVTEDIGEEIFAFAAEIYPICRSITGRGVRETLRAIGAHIQREWNIREAYIKNERGEKVVDFAQSNLHVMSYSVPVRQRISLAQLKQHVYTLPDQPDLIPYRTSYYADNWAFCMPHRVLKILPCENYEVVIDSALAGGYLTYG